MDWLLGERKKRGRKQGQKKKGKYRTRRGRKIAAKPLHTLSQTRLTISTLPWKLIRLFVGGPFLVNEYATAKRFIRLVKLISTQLALFGS
jgi:hypothetical protein